MKKAAAVHNPRSAAMGGPISGAFTVRYFERGKGRREQEFDNYDVAVGSIDAWFDSPAIGGKKVRAEVYQAGKGLILKTHNLGYEPNPAHGIQFVLGIHDRRPRGPRGGTTELQSVMFDKDVWDKATAARWLKDHNLKSALVESQANFWRFQQKPSKQYERFSVIEAGHTGAAANPRQYELGSSTEFSTTPPDERGGVHGPWMRGLRGSPIEILQKQGRAKNERWLIEIDQAGQKLYGWVYRNQLATRGTLYGNPSWGRETQRRGVVFHGSGGREEVIFGGTEAETERIARDLRAKGHRVSTSWLRSGSGLRRGWQGDWQARLATGAATNPPAGRSGNPSSPVVREIHRQLIAQGINPRLSFVEWDDNTLKVSRGENGSLIRFNVGTDLYDVTEYHGFDKLPEVKGIYVEGLLEAITPSFSPREGYGSERASGRRVPRKPGFAWGVKPGSAEVNPEIPRLVTDALQRYQREGNRGVDWAFDHASKADRDAVDAWLVQQNHPLAMRAGTQEFRLREIAKELAGRSGTGRGNPFSRRDWKSMLHLLDWDVRNWAYEGTDLRPTMAALLSAIRDKRGEAVVSRLSNSDKWNLLGVAEHVFDNRGSLPTGHLGVPSGTGRENPVRFVPVGAYYSGMAAGQEAAYLFGAEDTSKVTRSQLRHDMQERNRATDDYSRGFVQGWRRVHYMKAHGGAKRNPASAAALYEEFHGQPPDETLEFRDKIREHDQLAELGALVEMKIRTLTKLAATLRFDGDAPLLCSSPDGRQLYLQGGDQSLDLHSLKMDGEEWRKDSMTIGVIDELTYGTAKKFHHFKLTDYWHKLGEESGVQPFLLYDPVNKLMAVTGGQYRTGEPGIEN